MTLFKKCFLLLVFLVPLVSRAQTQQQVRILEDKVKNFHQVDSGVFRCAQPSHRNLKLMDSFGIDEVLNLRRRPTDEHRAKDTDLKLDRILLDAGKLTEDDLFAAMLVIRDRKGPIAIHCWHGSDRTGAVIAMYRIVFQHKTKIEAIKEMLEGGYGFHKRFANIPGLINSIDVDAFRERLYKTPAAI